MRNPFRRTRSGQFEIESERRISGLRRRGVQIACGNPARIIGTASAKLLELEASPNVLRTYHLGEEERERAIKKHFGLI